jgi:hypothetical protein
MRVRSIAAAVLISGAAVLGFVSPAQAVDRNGVCEDAEMCFFWDVNRQGSMTDFYSNVGDFGDQRFLSAGRGVGSRVKNNSASVQNRDRFYQGYVCYNEWGGGPCEIVHGNSWKNLTVTKNDNASFWFQCKFGCNPFG